jgi:hypothetical protein
VSKLHGRLHIRSSLQLSTKRWVQSQHSQGASQQPVGYVNLQPERATSTNKGRISSDKVCRSQFQQRRCASRGCIWRDKWLNITLVHQGQETGTWSAHAEQAGAALSLQQQRPIPECNRSICMADSGSAWQTWAAHVQDTSRYPGAAARNSLAQKLRILHAAVWRRESYANCVPGNYSITANFMHSSLLNEPCFTAECTIPEND